MSEQKPGPHGRGGNRNGELGYSPPEAPVESGGEGQGPVQGGGEVNIEGGFAPPEAPAEPGDSDSSSG